MEYLDPPNSLCRASPAIGSGNQNIRRTGPLEVALQLIEFLQRACGPYALLGSESYLAYGPSF